MTLNPTATIPQRRPELLAPAGDWDCVRAAVANGANAIYFGLPLFNARMRADNFTLEDLPKVVDYVHQRGVRAHVTLNTLIFTDELKNACEFVSHLAEAAVDAVIVQDLGLASIIKEFAPQIELHASTQMTVTSPEALSFVKRIGVQQVVLARELSLKEIQTFSKRDAGLPLEVFVHGALCVAYSGQCLTSEALGQRSANRGECAQACRQPYELFVDDEKRDLGDQRFLLSPQDLAAIQQIPDLVQAGIRTLKIEGRLKSAEYVAGVTRIYREAIDQALGSTSPKSPSSRTQYELEMLFSRGLYSGWLKGDHHQKLVHARFGKKRGPRVGTVESIGKNFVDLGNSLLEGLKPGDGLVFDSGGDTDDEEGGRVYEIKGTRLYFGRDRINFNRLHVGDRVWKTDDPSLGKELRKSFQKELPPKTTELNFTVEGDFDQPMKVTGTTSDALSAVELSELHLERAKTQALDQVILEKQFGKLGGTTFHLGSIQVQLPEGLRLPIKELNRLRRSIVEKLSSIHPRKDSIEVPEVEEVLSRRLKKFEREEIGINKNVRLRVLCRSLKQLEVALDCEVEEIYVDFEDIRGYKDAVEEVRRRGNTKIFLATPRIQKPGELGFFPSIARHEPDGLLIRNLGGLDYFKGSPLRLIADANLNVSNPLTAQLLIDEGLEQLTVSYDLNRDQVIDLLKACPDHWLEVTLHQHMAMFHMAHCVFAAFLSDGKDHTDCGRPCDIHRLEVRDHVGVRHPIHADVGCRNTVFHGQAQSGAFCFEDFKKAGLGSIRVELLDEDPLESRRIIESYQGLLEGRFNIEEVLKRLRVQSKLGVTRGPLEVMSASNATRKPRGGRR